MVAHKTIVINGLYRAHSVRPDSTHPDLLGFETAWVVRPYTSIVLLLSPMWETPQCADSGGPFLAPQKKSPL